MKIVLVDDLPKKRLIEALRKMPGITVKEYRNLDKALAYVLANHWSVDLMLVDQVFDNLVDGDVLQSGLELGREVSQLYPYVCMVMFTANAHTTETQRTALKKSGFIDFLQKTDLTDRTIKSILDEIEADPMFVEKNRQRSEAKREQLLLFFRSLSPGVRENLLTGHNVKDGNLNNAGELVDLIALFEGYEDLTGHTDQEIHSLLLRFLHETETEIEFKGDWKKGLYNRVMLKNYEVAQDHRWMRHQIEYETINFLLNALDLIEHRGYDGKVSMKINKFYASVAFGCKANDARRHLYFQQKMIGRRVAITFSQIVSHEKEPLSMHNIMMLLKEGETGTYETLKPSGIAYRKYQISRAGTRVNSMLNSTLGLSFHRVAPDGVPDKKGTPDEICDFKIETGDNFILYEELQFLEKYGEHISELRTYLDNFEFPDQVALDHKLGGLHLVDLEDLQRVLLQIRRVSEPNYQIALQAIQSDLPKNLKATIQDFLKLGPVTTVTGTSMAN